MMSWLVGWLVGRVGGTVRSILWVPFSTLLEPATHIGNVRVERLSKVVITARQSYGEDRTDVMFFFETGNRLRCDDTCYCVLGLLVPFLQSLESCSFDRLLLMRLIF